MRALNHHAASPSMTLVTESMDVATTFHHVMARISKKTRQVLSTLFNGGHELYRAHTETKIYQQCLLCGYETTGWTIDRRDRRLHLVANSSQQTATGRR